MICKRAPEFYNDLNNPIAPGIPGYGVRCQNGGKKKYRSIKTRNNKLKSKTRNNKLRSKTRNNKLRSKTRNNKFISKARSNKFRSKTRNNKLKSKSKKLDLIIKYICKRMKRKCTPQYKRILKKIVKQQL